MTRRDPLVRRQPNGQPHRPRADLMSPTEVKRMVDAAKHGLRDPVWASHVGLLKARGQITNSQFSAAVRWKALLEEYAKATQAPREPRSANLDPKGGTPPDPDSASGRKEARRHAKTVEAHITALKLIRALGEAPTLALRDVVERDLYPAGPHQLAALRGALAALSALWGRK